jgi:iron(III) transport system substrate-binding protein
MNPRYPAILLPLLLLALAALAGCSPEPKRSVILYASQDEVFADPVLREFSHQSGITVRTLFDGEAVKTVGLANRLLSESNQPQADLFWNNEELRTRQLATAGMFERSNGWWRLGQRMRRIVVNTGLVAKADQPASLLELTNSRWRGRVAMAYPGFGSTATHLLVLRQRWGETNWLAWCRALAANRPLLVEGNSMVVRTVSRGAAAVGLTDSDDIAAARRGGQRVEAVSTIDTNLIALPNTLGIVRGGPHPEEARILAASLQQTAVLQQLVNAGALEDVAAGPAVLSGEEWDRLIAELPAATRQLGEIFLR